MTDVLLQMKSICKDFSGVKALDAVSLNVRSGSVHALMGENGAGKSTLMKCLFGIYHPEGGQILLDAKAVSFKSPKQALDSGIAMIHQELHPVRSMTVMENIWLGRFPVHTFGPLRFVSHKDMLSETQALFKELGISLDPRRMMGRLSVSETQFIEIAKAVSLQSRVIIMDEPTSSLTGSEVERLFAIIEGLKGRGVAIIYISHKMEEILRIADDVSVMRDGKMIGTWPAAELTIDTIIQKMVGRELNQLFPPKRRISSAPIMRVEGLTAKSERSVQEVSFELRKGEILGVGGMMGSQRSELLELIFGLRSRRKGDISIAGRKASLHSSRDAIKHGLALLTEDRRSSGIFPDLSVKENIVIARQKSYRKNLGLLSEGLRTADALRVIKDLRVKTASPQLHMRYLSGGNQQKALLGRWLLIDPKILLLDEPTRGIDVGAKAEIYSLIHDLAGQGKSVIVVSSEMPELIGLSNRILVMCEGRMSGMLEEREISEESILRLATRFIQPI